MNRPILLALLLAFFSFSAIGQNLLVQTGEKGLYVEHRVAKSEGMYAIGRNYNVPPKELAAYNQLDLNTGLEIGQLIRIPLNAANFNQKGTGAEPIYYMTGQGEGLMKVSKRNQEVTLARIRQWNKLKNDNISAGQQLIIGYLVSKDYKAPAPVPASEVATNETAGTTQPLSPKPPVITENNTSETREADSSPTKPVAAKTPEATTRKPVEPAGDKDPARPAQDQQAPARNQSSGNKTTGSPAGDNTGNVAPGNTASGRLSSEDGYFKASFDQQVRQTAISSNQTLTSGIFKTNSGWQDAKYYLLMDGVATGTIVRIVNPENNKAVYAKVLGEMNGIRQNQGLDLRISNAAASALGVTDDSKFIVKVSH